MAVDADLFRLAEQRRRRPPAGDRVTQQGHGKVKERSCEGRGLVARSRCDCVKITAARARHCRLKDDGRVEIVVVK